MGVRASSGLTALTLMIQKMPPVANKALDHFHRTDRPNRKQYFYLHLLEPSLPGQLDAIAKTPMQVCETTYQVINCSKSTIKALDGCAKYI